MLFASTSAQQHDIGESYYRLAIFCFKQSKTQSIVHELETEKLLIKSILRGMRHDSKKARLQFPRLLQIGNVEELNTLFNQEVIIIQTIQTKTDNLTKYFHDAQNHFKF